MTLMAWAMATKMTNRYRVVVDYGWGDKTWIERDLTLREIVEYFKEQHSCDIFSIRQRYMDADYRYYWESDHPDDVEDWNWEDS